MNSKSFSMRLPNDTENKLELLAKSMGRTKSFIALSAIEEYVKTHIWQIEAIEKGLEQIEHGETISHEEVRKIWENRRGN